MNKKIMGIGLISLTIGFYACKKEELTNPGNKDTTEIAASALKVSGVTPIVDYPIKFNFHRRGAGCSGFGVCILKPYDDYDPQPVMYQEGWMTGVYSNGGINYVDFYLSQEPTDIEPVFFGLGELPFDFSSSMCSMIGETSCIIIPDDYIWHNSPIDANDPSGNLINFPYGYISVKVEI